ncbi:MAG TPA: hypothetical protein VLW26_06285 [Steroidobacteraceae bacterium]|nr:hypothetical protein [Steroidobacteraceae bacterium]
MTRDGSPWRPFVRPAAHQGAYRCLQLIAGLVALLAAPAALAGALVVNVHMADGRALPGVVVTVQPLEGSAKPNPPIEAVMDQIDLAFSPDLLVIPVGSTVTFPNSDTTSHQVYSFSPAHPFQLPLYRGKPRAPERFDRAGLVTLGCNIHDNMLAYIVVTDAAYFGRTSASGAWSQSGVARGKYRVTIWYPRVRDAAANLQRDVTIGDVERAEVSVKLEKTLRPAPLEKRPHSWDAY